MVSRELYLRKVRPFIGTDVVKVITGMRRSGKSVLLELIQAELRQRNPKARVFSVNLDDDENKRLLAKGVLYEHVNGLLQEAGDEMVYLFFFDEIHDVEEWKTAVNSLRMRKNADNQLLENVVYFEFLRRGYEVTIGRAREKEVDFVCDRGSERLYVQVAFSLGSEENREREYGALEQIKTADAKLLLTMDRLDMSDGTIRHFYIPDFLASKSAAVKP